MHNIPSRLSQPSKLWCGSSGHWPFDLYLRLRNHSAESSERGRVEDEGRRVDTVPTASERLSGRVSYLF